MVDEDEAKLSSCSCYCLGSCSCCCSVASVWLSILTVICGGGVGSSIASVWMLDPTFRFVMCPNDVLIFIHPRSHPPPASFPGSSPPLAPRHDQEMVVAYVISSKVHACLRYN